MSGKRKEKMSEMSANHPNTAAPKIEQTKHRSPPPMNPMKTASPERRMTIPAIGLNIRWVSSPVDTIFLALFQNSNVRVMPTIPMITSPRTVPMIVKVWVPMLDVLVYISASTKKRIANTEVAIKINTPDILTENDAHFRNW